MKTSFTASKEAGLLLSEARYLALIAYPADKRISKLAEAYFEACKAAAVWENAFDKISQSPLGKRITQENLLTSADKPANTVPTQPNTQ